MKETIPNIATKNNSIAIYQNEAFDNGFYKYFKDIDQNKISQVLNSTDRKTKFDSISYRELNSWEKEGLLTVQREGREWRKFSVIDALWVKLIKELRGFG
ncbi:MAG: MerR family transcriptional regulator, partial [Chitinophagaceae bacterium]